MLEGIDGKVRDGIHTLIVDESGLKALSWMTAFCIGRIRFDGRFSTAIDFGLALNHRYGFSRRSHAGEA